MSEEVDDRVKGPQGLGGWLLIPLLGLAIALVVAARMFVGGSLVLFQPELWESYSTPGSLLYRSPWIVTIVVAAVVQVILIVVSFLALMGAVMKKKWSPATIVSAYLLGVVLGLMDFAMSYFFAPQIMQPVVVVELVRDSRRYLISAVLMSVIWVPYFMKSQRVRNTFVR